MDGRLAPSVAHHASARHENLRACFIRQPVAATRVLPWPSRSRTSGQVLAMASCTGKMPVALPSVPWPPAMKETRGGTPQARRRWACPAHGHPRGDPKTKLAFTAFLTIESRPYHCRTVTRVSSPALSRSTSFSMIGGHSGLSAGGDTRATVHRRTMRNERRGIRRGGEYLPATPLGPERSMRQSAKLAIV